MLEHITCEIRNHPDVLMSALKFIAVIDRMPGIPCD